MVKKIVWTENAMQDRLQIIEYWITKIGNSKYAEYLDSCFEDLALTVAKFPEIGRLYNNTEYKFMVKDSYLLFYYFDKSSVYILSIFDNRRNPGDLNRNF